VRYVPAAALYRAPRSMDQKFIPDDVAQFVIDKIDSVAEAPEIRYHTFGQSSIEFTFALRAREFTDAATLKHEFIKRFHARYARERIALPFPTRTVYLKTDSDAAEKTEAKA
jgi:small-conductance mechanosensitive channel